MAREVERLKATLTLCTRLFLRELREPSRLTTRLKLFEPTEAVVFAEGRRKASFNALFGERERTARNNAYAGVTNPVCSTTPSRTTYRSRRHFYVLIYAASHSLRRSGSSPQSYALRGPLIYASPFGSPRFAFKAIANRGFA